MGTWALGLFASSCWLLLPLSHNADTVLKLLTKPAAPGITHRTVLTHFSQRYPRVPGGIDAWALPLRCRPAIAFDGMLLPLAALPALPHVMPPLALALGEPPQQPTAAVAGLALEEENVTEGGQDEQEVVLD